MKEDIEEAFYRYMERVVNDLQSEKTKHAATLAAYPTFETTLLDRILGKLESGAEFESLVASTEAIAHQDCSSQMRKHGVGDFFRRSGIYDHLKTGLVPEIGPALERYRAAFSKTSKCITHMCPLDLLHMEGTVMQVQTFELRKFSESELLLFLGQKVNRQYYKSAVLDLENLHHYWWLLHREEVPLQYKPGGAGENDDRARLHLTRHEEIEMPMKILALYNWLIRPMYIDYFADGVPGCTWTPPAFPFVIRTHDNLLEEPASIEADLNQLLLAVSYESDSDRHSYGPLDYWSFDGEATAAFEIFLRRTESMVLALKGIPEWQFLSMALDYLLKAFECKGKEQLVWHIIALESLLGQRGEPLTESIGLRLAAISAADQDEQRQIKKKFRELYNFRCDVVHGNSTGKEVLLAHLNEARYFARDTLMWFLYFLTGLREHWNKERPSQPLPSRKDLLCLLDMSPAARSGLGMIKSAMPEGFPHLPQWLE